MIIDLNIKGKNVIVFGGGCEAVRKVGVLLTQDCHIIVVAESIHPDIRGWNQSGNLQLKEEPITNGDCLKKWNDSILVIAATDDRKLNRELVEAAKKRGCYTYAVDDPEHSDFSHPAVINLEDTVQIALSTGGRSPLVARRLRERLEPVLKGFVTLEDILLIQLQEILRTTVKDRLSNPEIRKSFLTQIADDPKILGLLGEKNLDEAVQHALNLLDGFVDLL